MSGAGAAMASEALDLASMMAWLGWVPQRTAGVPAMYGMYRDVCFFPIVGQLRLQPAGEVVCC